MDAIWNDGVNVHNSSPSTWKDLTGNHSILLDGNATFDTNKVTLNGDGKFTFTSDAIKNAINSNSCTIECLLSPKQHGSPYNCFYLKLCSSARGFWVWDNANYYMSGVAYRDTITSWGPNISWASKALTRIILFGRSCYLIRQNASSNNTINKRDNVTNGESSIGDGTICDYYAIRIYNRILTSSEIEYNKKLDNKRFNVSMP